MSLILLWVTAAIIFLAADMLWLTWLAKDFYAREIGGLVRDWPNMAAAVLFYLLFVTGLLIFVLRPAYYQNSIVQAAMYGAAFGLVAYGTYDLTSLAVLKGFTVKVAAADMAWGAALTSLTSALTVWLSRIWS